MQPYSDAHQQLLALLGERPDTVALVDTIENADKHDAGTVETAVASILTALRSGGRELGESFWDSPAGQLIAAAQWRLYETDLIAPVDAADAIFRDQLAAGRITKAAARVFVLRRMKTGDLTTYRRPNTDFHYHRKDRQRTRRAWFVRRSEVNSKAAFLASQWEKRRKP